MKSRFFGSSFEASIASTNSVDQRTSSIRPENQFKGRFAKLFLALQADRIESAKQYLAPRKVSTDQELCSICLSPTMNTATIDSCSHQYCYICITLWAKVNPSCPNCKKMFRIVQSVQHANQLEYFEPPPSDESEGEEAGMNSDSDDDSQRPVNEESPVRAIREEYCESDSSGYSYDGGFICDDDEIDYESCQDDDLPEIEPLSDSDFENDSASKNTRKHRRARRRNGLVRGRKRRKIDDSVGEPGGCGVAAASPHGLDSADMESSLEHANSSKTTVIGPPQFDRFVLRDD